MNFLQNIKYKLANLMRGRYGMDQLYKALLFVMLLFLVLNLVFPSMLFYALSLATGAYAVFRAFSRNSTKRAAENRMFLTFQENSKKRLLLLRNRLRDWKTHRYRTCPSCKTILRLPKKQGINQVKCPVCKNETDFTIRF